MDYAKIASQVIENVGGKQNIKSVQHCATRLRLQLKNNDLRNEEAVSDIEGVKGVFLTQSQFQIIFGSGLVNLVCDEVQKQLGIAVDTSADDEKEEKKGNALQRLVKLLSDIFVPIIPAIVAGGLLMGLNNILTAAMFHGKSVIDLYPQWKGLATAINLFASAPFTFLPVLIGFSATKKFGGNPYLGAAMGMIMVHPDLLSAYSIGIAQPPVWNIFGFKIAAIGYQGTVLPVLAVAFILATIEKKLHKVTPTWLDNLTTPLISIMVTSFLTFIFVGPVLREAGNLLADGITWVYNTLGFVGGGLFGLAYAPICLTGMHHSFIAIETQLIAAKATTGGSFIFTTASMNNVAQGAAVLAVLFLTKNEKMKSICSASGVSALLGITEPAMFGVTLKLKYPFYAAIIGSAVGNAYCAATGVLAQALGAAGLPGFLSMLPKDYLNFAIGLILSMAVSAVLTAIFWKKFNIEREDNKAQTSVKEEVKEAQVEEAVTSEDSEETVEEKSEAALLQEKVDELQAKLTETEGRMLRLQADFENYKRRVQMDKQAAEKYRAQSLVSDILPALDNFERAMQVEATDEQMKSLLQGMEMVYRQLLEAMTKEGVEAIEAVGKQFDPHEHQAVMQVEDSEFESNAVVEEFQKGYKLKDRVIRPSMVKVNQ